jgi:hypothetical protein
LLALNTIEFLAQATLPDSQQNPNSSTEGAVGTLLGLSFTPLMILIFALVILAPFLVARSRRSERSEANPYKEIL